jgi:hypothetical protein
MLLARLLRSLNLLADQEVRLLCRNNATLGAAMPAGLAGSCRFGLRSNFI